MHVRSTDAHMHEFARHIRLEVYLFASSTRGFQRVPVNLPQLFRDFPRAARHYYDGCAHFFRRAPTFANSAADIRSSGEQNVCAGARLLGGNQDLRCDDHHYDGARCN